MNARELRAFALRFPGRSAAHLLALLELARTFKTQ